jgi:ribonuclease VapC
VTVFVDASALIALITGEEGADALADRLQAAPRRLCSALSVWETVASLCRSYAFSVPDAQAHVQRFIEAADLRFIGIGEREFEIAIDAYARFGKGRHPAALNMGDCYAYASAKANRAALLFKGDDFTKTDVADMMLRAASRS